VPKFKPGGKSMSERPDRRGIPTLYRGVQYRSRLEAKWAAMFDLLGWEYQYEPFDLEGWIPDFLLTRAKVLIEVKPVTTLPLDIQTEITLTTPKDYEALILGCVPTVPARWPVSPDFKTGKEICRHLNVDRSDGAAIGWMLGRPAPWQKTMSSAWGLGLVQQFRDEDGHDFGVGLFHAYDPWFHVDPGCDPGNYDTALTEFAWNRTGVHGKPEWWGIGTAEECLIKRLWNQATNAVQWRGVRSESQS
jgi:hypothetical protein